MIRLAADENFNHAILDGLLRRLPDVDLVIVQRTALLGAADPALLEWCAHEMRILLTHDVRTVPAHANERLRRGYSMSGVIAVRQRLPVGRAIEDLLLLFEASREDELAGRVHFVPL